MKSALKVTIFTLALSLLPTITGVEPAKAALVTSGLELNLDASVAGSYNGTTWFDQSGGGFNATQVNSPTYNASDGSFTLNGTNQYFNLGNVKAKTGAFTIEVTFTPNSVSGTPALVARQNTAVAGNYFLGISNSKVNHYVESSPWGLNGNSTLTTNTKYVATMVYDSSKNITPYLNGTLNGTATNFAGTLSNNPINLQIGAALNSSSASDFFSGKIYSVRFKLHFKHRFCCEQLYLSNFTPVWVALTSRFFIDNYEGANAVFQRCHEFQFFRQSHGILCR
jgi:Concanavalin A-like lectin/glucanases superfamily